MTESADNRRRQVARQDFEHAFQITGVTLAEKYGVTTSQISQDRRSDVYADEISKCDGGRLHRIRAKAWVFLEKAIDAGFDALEEGEHAPKGVIHRAYDAVRLIIEKTVDWTQPGHSPATALLEKIFSTAADLELESEIQDLKAQISDLEAVHAQQTAPGAPG